MEENWTEYERVMRLSIDAGQILLENGAEIFRVGDTIQRICHAYGVTAEKDFVLSNGIFLTCASKEEHFAEVRHIPVKSCCLERIVAVNELSRKIEMGEYDLCGAEQRLEEIRRLPGMKKSWKILAAGIGTGFFCYFFGGSLSDSIIAFLAGCLVYLVIFSLPGVQLSKITGNTAGGFLVTLFCGAAYLAGAGEHMNYMIIGSIMPLVPGVAFINAIREVASGDYLSGMIRMLDTILVFFCIAVGVGSGIFILNKIAGGVFL